MARKALKIIILAAGKGTRMKSEKAKVLHEIMGRPMLDYVIETAESLDSEGIYVVVGYQSGLVQGFCRGRQVRCVIQGEQLGTGHAVACAGKELEGYGGNVLILSGDVPLLRADTLHRFYDGHVSEDADLTILSTVVEDPKNYGRIIKDEAGSIMRIVEEKDASPEEKEVKEINTGIYCAKASRLLDAVAKVDRSNAQGEYYLTDAVQLMKRSGYKIVSVAADNERDVMGVNTRADLAVAAAIKREEINEKLMMGGVTIVDPSSTYIEASVIIGEDTVIHPHTVLLGRSHIAGGCIIHPFCHIADSIVGRGVSIGPFVSIKNGVILEGENVEPFRLLVG